MTSFDVDQRLVQITFIVSKSRQGKSSDSSHWEVEAAKEIENKQKVLALVDFASDDGNQLGLELSALFEETLDVENEGGRGFVELEFGHNVFNFRFGCFASKLNAGNKTLFN